MKRLEHGLLGSYQGDQTAMSKLDVKNNRILRSQQVLSALMAWLYQSREKGVVSSENASEI